MKSKKKRLSIVTEVVVSGSKRTISSVAPVMTIDQKKMLNALGMFLL